MALPPSVTPALQSVSITASPSLLKAKEIDQMFDFFSLQITKENPEQFLQRLYKLLIEKGFSIDTALQRFEKDIKTFDPKKLFEGFANSYGEELEMSLRQIQYAVDPALTPSGSTAPGVFLPMEHHHW